MLKQSGKLGAQFRRDTKPGIFERLTKVIALFATLTNVAECALVFQLRLSVRIAVVAIHVRSNIPTNALKTFCFTSSTPKRRKRPNR
jgi:hypothetical protein